MKAYGMTHRLEWRQKRKRWEFPRERFVTYEPSDEAWCRPLGVGHEVEEEISVVIPRAIVTGMTEDGIQFTAMPDDGQTPSR